MVVCLFVSETCLNKYLGRILLIYNCLQQEHKSVSDKGKKGGVVPAVNLRSLYIVLLTAWYIRIASLAYLPPSR